MPKILVLTSLFPNKIKPDLGIFIKKRMFAYAQKQGCSIQVVAPVPYYPDIKYFRKFQHYSQVPSYEVMEGIKVYHPRYPMIPKMSMLFHGRLMYFGIKNFITRLNKTYGFDIIDAHFIYPDCQAGVFLGELLNLPVVVSARGSDINQYLYYSKIKPQIINTLNKSTHIISVCQALKDMMVEVGVDENKITVIPNGIDNNRFYLLDQKTIREKLNLDLHKQIILSVGALIPRKGHDLTIQAVARLINSRPNLQLYIIGSGPEEKRLKALIESLNLEGSVFLTGQVPNDELVAWYNAADLFCLSSDKEGWPNVLTEALSCGTPVVATKVFGALEIVKNNTMGILVKKSVDDISNGIDEVFSNNWNRHAISREMSERTWHMVADECEQVFYNVMANEKNPSRVSNEK